MLSGQTYQKKSGNLTKVNNNDICFWCYFNFTELNNFFNTFFYQPVLTGVTNAECAGGWEGEKGGKEPFTGVPAIN